MKHFFKIGAFLMLLVILTAEDCSNSNTETTGEDKLSGMFREIENDFVNDELSVETLSAFEKRAVQKLNDVADYINIYADTSLSIQFRTQASQMIRENFFENIDVQNFYRDIELHEDTVNGFLFLSGNTSTFKTEIDSIVISDRLQIKSSFNYMGEIQFTQRVADINLADTISVHNFKRQIAIVATKTKKQFGDKTEDVWEVFLGEIRF